MAYPYDDNPYSTGDQSFIPYVTMTPLGPDEPFSLPQGPGPMTQEMASALETSPPLTPRNTMPTGPLPPVSGYVQERPNAYGMDTSPWGGVLDSLATAFANTDFGTPNNFGSGLLKGFAQGFAAVRGKRMTERERQRQTEEDFAKKRNEANLQATLDGRARAQKLQDEARTRRAKREDFLYEESVKSMFKENPDGTFTLTEPMARIAGPGFTAGQTVDKSTYQTLLGEVLQRDRPREARTSEIEVTPQAKSIIDSVKAGKIAPSFFTQMSRSGTLRDQVMVGLAQEGVDLNGLENDYQSDRAFLRTQNGSKFMTIRANGQALLHTLDRAEDAFVNLRRMVPSLSVTGLNKAQLALLKQRNDSVGEAARRLDVLVNDVVPEIGSMVMGGNGNTDHSLELASHNLSSDWNEVQFLDAVKQARLTTRTRLNAMNSLQPYELNNQPNPAIPSFQAALDSQGIKTQDQFNKFLDAKDKNGKSGRQRMNDQGLSDSDIDALRGRFR